MLSFIKIETSSQVIYNSLMNDIDIESKFSVRIKSNILSSILRDN